MIEKHPNDKATCTILIEYYYHNSMIDEAIKIPYHFEINSKIKSIFHSLGLANYNKKCYYNS